MVGGAGSKIKRRKRTGRNGEREWKGSKTKRKEGEGQRKKRK